MVPISSRRPRRFLLPVSESSRCYGALNERYNDRWSTLIKKPSTDWRGFARWPGDAKSFATCFRPENSINMHSRQPVLFPWFFQLFFEIRGFFLLVVIRNFTIFLIMKLNYLNVRISILRKTVATKIISTFSKYAYFSIRRFLSGFIFHFHSIKFSWSREGTKQYEI